MDFWFTQMSWGIHLDFLSTWIPYHIILPMYYFVSTSKCLPIDQPYRTDSRLALTLIPSQLVRGGLWFEGGLCNYVIPYYYRIIQTFTDLIITDLHLLFIILLCITLPLLPETMSIYIEDGWLYIFHEMNGNNEKKFNILKLLY